MKPDYSESFVWFLVIAITLAAIILSFCMKHV